jgi:uncharacterized protein YecA (UPF0149 family)
MSTLANDAVNIPKSSTGPKTKADESTSSRNATCLCGSGTKFKRCCGKDAPPALNKAA